MIDHVNYTIKDQKDYSLDTIKQDKKSWIVKYDDAGNYIGDDPIWKDSEYKESEIDEEKSSEDK